MSIKAGIQALLTPKNETIQIVIDTSSYQTTLKPEEMPAVQGYILKGGQGDYSADHTFLPQYKMLTAKGKRVAMYWWVDPLEGVDGHVAKILSVLKDAPKINIIVLDIEQEWVDWSEWPNHITKFLAGKTISDCGKRIAQKLAGMGYKVVIYSRMTFMKSYSPQMLDWVYGYDLMLAQYPYHATVNTWADWISKVLPAIRRYWPVGPKGKSAKIWQCSGDGDKLPGAYGSTGKLSALDISLMSMTDAEMDLWWEHCEEVEAPVQKTVTYILTYAPWRNLRKEPNTTSEVKGRVLFGKEFQISLIRGDWGQLPTGEWILISNGVKIQ